MSKIYFVAILCGSIFCATSSFAQLSANPWVDANTKEQVNQVYEKHQRRGYRSTDVEYIEESEVIIEKTKEHIEELEEQDKPSIIEKFASNFNKEEKIEQKQVQEDIDDVSSDMAVDVSNSSFDLGDKVDSLKNSFRFPSFNTNNIIRKFERSIGVDFKAMARKFK